MSKSLKQKICIKGHHYFKSSDCPICPFCEAEKKAKVSFLSQLGAPARRALERAGIDSFTKLANFSEAEILQLHGIGKSTIPKLLTALQQEGLQFNKRS